MIKILVLAANPLDTDPLRLDEEVSAIRAAVGNRFDVRYHRDIRSNDLQKLLSDYTPHIVHFCGHGRLASSNRGQNTFSSQILLQDETGHSVPVPTDALRRLFYLLRGNIRCVVLNACYTVEQAEAIGEHIDCVVGMTDQVYDNTARKFATAFYQALAHEHHVETAFDLGCLEIELEGLGEADTPQLLGVADPRQVRFVELEEHEPHRIITSSHRAESFFKSNRWALGLFIVAQLLLSILFLSYRDRFLLPWWPYWVATILLGASIWGWNQVAHLPPSTRVFKKAVAVTIAITLSLSGLIGQQAWTALYPQKIPQEKFGIAIATFDDGSVFPFVSRGGRIADFLVESLNYVLFIEGKQSDFPNDIEVRRIGLVQRVKESKAAGNRVGADLVLWGQVLEGTTVFNFQLLETPWLTNDPAFPRTLPIDPGLDVKVDIRDFDTLDIEEVSSPQNLGFAHFSLGLFHYANQLNFQEATRQFKKAQTHLLEAKRLIEQKSSEKLGVLTNTTNLGLVYYYLGKSYQLQGRYDDSQKALHLAATFNHDDPATLLAQMYNYRQLGYEAEKHDKLQEVIDVAQGLAGKEENTSEGIAALYNLAHAYVEKGDLQQALAMLDAIIKQAPNFFIAYISKAQILIKLNLFSEAKDLYQKAEDLANNIPSRKFWIHLGRGQIAEKENQLIDALNEYSEASMINSTHPQPYLYLAQVNEKADEPDKAWLNYQKYRDHSSNPSLANYTLAEFWHRRGAYQDAIDLYHKALHEAGVKKSKISDCSGVEDKAEIPVRLRAISEIHVRLGATYALLYNEDQARKCFEEALTNSGVSAAQTLESYAYSLVHLGLVEEALERFEQSIAMRADRNLNAVVRLNVGQLYTSIGELARARFHYETLLVEDSQIADEHRLLAQQRLTELEALEHSKILIDQQPVQGLRKK